MPRGRTGRGRSGSSGSSRSPTWGCTFKSRSSSAPSTSSRSSGRSSWRRPGDPDRHDEPPLLHLPHGVPVLDHRERLRHGGHHRRPDHVRRDGVLPDPRRRDHAGDPMTRRGVDVALTLLTYVVALVMVAPIAWMALTAFKTEPQAFQIPPLLLWRPTLENFRYAFHVAEFGRFFANTAAIGIGSTLLACLLGIPAAYSLAFYPTRRTRDVLFFVLS